MGGRRRRVCLSAAACALAWIAAETPAAAPGGTFFTVAERDGAWWFIDPAGEPFFSLGVNVLKPGAGRGG
jgi:hypothetical protein